MTAPTISEKTTHVPVKAVLIDFGGVLGDFSKQELACLRLAHLSGQTSTPKQAEKLAKQMYADLCNNEFENKRQRGEISGKDFFYYCQKKYTLYLRLVSYDVFRVLWGEIFSRNACIGAVVKELRRRGLPIFVLSNAEELYWPFVLKLAKEFGFDEGQILPSFMVGARKPEDKYWEQAIRLAGVPVENILFIGDEEEHVDKFRSLGGKALRYHDNGRAVWTAEFYQKLASLGI